MTMLHGNETTDLTNKWGDNECYKQKFSSKDRLEFD